MSKRNQMTLSFRDVEQFQKRVKKFEIENHAALKAAGAQKRDLYQAAFNVALDHSDEVVAEIRRLQAGDDE